MIPRCVKVSCPLSILEFSVLTMKKLFFPFYLLLIILALQLETLQASGKQDSLENVLRSLPARNAGSPDTLRIHVMNELSREYIKSGDHDRSLNLAAEAKKLAETVLASKKGTDALKQNLRKHISNSLHNTATVYYYQGDYDKALDQYLISLALREEINDVKGIGLSANNIGNIYNNKGDYANALNYYLKSLKVRESLGDKKGMAASFNNIGSLYESQKEFSQALDYFKKSLKLREEISDLQGTALALNNIGNVYYNIGSSEMALDHYKKSLDIRIKIGDKQGMADCYHNIGNIYQKQGSVDEGLVFHQKALALREDLGDKLRMCFSYRNIGLIFLEKNQIQHARNNLLKSLSLAKEVSAKPDIMSAYRALAKIDSASGDFRSAFEYHKDYLLFKDSIHNEESTKKLIQSAMRYEFDKKEQAARLEQEKKDAISDALLREQTMQRNAFIAGFGLMMALSFVSYRSYRNKRKSHEIIAHQKAMVEERNKDILDSINYAKRIQDALLKDEEHVSPHLPEHFIYFKPKDIVSGDFYWVSEKKGYLYLAAADCTGHGVPGAFMSMLGMAFLNEITAAGELLAPSEILDRLRDKIVRELSQPLSDEHTNDQSRVKDGMDISLLQMDVETREIWWSGANNPVYIVKANENLLLEIKPDKQPIGFHSHARPFTTHHLQLEKNDMVYLFTDGYADQFGGEKGKKFKYSKLKELLQTIAHQHATDQKAMLDHAFVHWKGSLEQVDDICLVGIRA